MGFKPHDLEANLIQWDLYKSYGQFNLYFECLIGRFRELLITLVKKYYGFNVDWEDPKTTEVLSDHLQDRVIKILLHDVGASGIIEKCRSCFLDMMDNNVRKVLSENDIELIQLSDSDIEFAKILFKKGSDLTKLRNVIIHTHYNEVEWDFFPISELHGRKDAKTASGYEERIYKFNAEYFEKLNVQVNQMTLFVNNLISDLILSEGNDNFSKGDFAVLEAMNFSIRSFKRSDDLEP